MLRFPIRDSFLIENLRSASAPARVTDVAVTMDAILYFAAVLGRQHGVHQLPVTFQAGLLGHPPVARLDPDGLVEVARRERKGVEEPVIRLRQPLADEVVAQVAITAGCNVPVAGGDPGVEVALHDVAIGTGLRVVGQVGETVAVPDRESAEAAEYTYRDREGEGEYPDTAARAGFRSLLHKFFERFRGRLIQSDVASTVPETRCHHDPDFRRIFKRGGIGAEPGGFEQQLVASSQ